MSSPAAWHPDPTGRHDHRWWDGEQWTEHVADAGVAGVDPLDAPESTAEQEGTQPLPRQGASDSGAQAGSGWAGAATGDATGGQRPDQGSAGGWQQPDQGSAGGWQQPAPDSSGWTPGAQAGTWQPATGSTAGAGAQGRDGVALAALVVGLLSLPLLIACGLGVLTGIVAIVLGFVGLSRAKRAGTTGRGMAITGIVAGFVAIAIAIGVLATFGGTATRYAECLSRTGDEAFCEEQLENELLGRFGL